MPRPQGSLASTPPMQAATGRVLFMDDDPHISYLTGTMLTNLGYEFDLVKDGTEALKFFESALNLGRLYDLVILDLTIINGMGAEEAFKQMRDLAPKTRAIIVSGYDNDEKTQEYLEKGFSGYLTKPYRADDLSAAITQALKR
jgi:two-component system, cell cycle sensor histidine kinase and response regulator CckA